PLYYTLLLSSTTRPPPLSSLFPYTTLFRSTNIPYSAQNQYGQLTTSFAQTGLDTNITPSVISPKSDSISLTVTFTVKALVGQGADRKSTRLNSSHVAISYAVFCLKKKKQTP